MSSIHQFGGDWTEDKLVRLEKYLSAYMQIFDKNPWAKRYTTYYVDAFAGTGDRTDSGRNDFSTIGPFGDDDAQDVVQFYRGSARIALEISPAFNRYIFIDQNPRFTDDLTRLREDFPSRRDSIDVIHADANQFLQEWCDQMDWEHSRAVVFLAGCRREGILYTGKFLPDRPYIVVESTEVRATRSGLPKIASHSTEIWAIYQSNLSPTSC